MKAKIKTVLDKMTKERPKPQTPRAGYKASGNRYSQGGKVRKKSV